MCAKGTLGGVEKHRGRPKTDASCSELRGSARVGDVLSLESLHEGELRHRERLSDSDSEWNRQSARARAARNGHHARVRTTWHQLLQLVRELLGGQGRLANEKINCDTNDMQHKSTESRTGSGGRQGGA